MSIVTKESNPELYNALFPEDKAKEILEKIKSVSDFDDYVEFVGTEFKPFLDYITNQDKKITNLEQENQALKQRNEEIYKGFMETTKELAEVSKENEKLTHLWLDSQEKRRKAV